PNDTGISRELIVFKAHEPLSTKLLTKQLKKDMVCIDIGANIGYYALLESKITKRVIALEPSPLNYKILLDNIRLNNIQNIQPYNIAVGDRNGDTEFLISDRSNWSRIPQKIYTVEAYGQESVSSIKVPIVTLDSFIDKQKIDQVNFVRMDIEGYEYHALKGMHKTLEFRPLLQIEIHFQLLGINKTEAILKKLQDHGYETSYYIDHGIDMSIIGTSNDIEKSSITKIIQLLNSRTDHHAFHLLTSPEI
ncbi:MAG: FkbM family methyltransferase, partial [Nitrososphaerales archaeon]